MSVEPQQLTRVRSMRSGDVPAVLAIERLSYGYPWSERVFRDCLRVGYRAWVATRLDDEISAYGLLSVTAGEAHVLNLCVAPDRRRRGVAAQVLEAMIDAARASNAQSVLLEVRPSNHAARRLYKRRGFVRIATRPGYYPAPGAREDALLLALDLVD